MKEYSVDIDFDESSRKWKENKKQANNGTYQYICMAKTKLGHKCKNKPLIHQNYCRVHQNTTNNI